MNDPNEQNDTGIGVQDDKAVSSSDGLAQLGRWLTKSSQAVVDRELSDADVPTDVRLIMVMLYELADSTEDHANDLFADGFTLRADETHQRAERYQESYHELLRIWR